MEKQCECIVHRYHVFHITPEGDVFSHSQSSWDWAKLHGKTENIVTVSTREYRHDLTREQAKAMYTQLRLRYA